MPARPSGRGSSVDINLVSVGYLCRELSPPSRNSAGGRTRNQQRPATILSTPGLADSEAAPAGSGLIHPANLVGEQSTPHDPDGLHRFWAGYRFSGLLGLRGVVQPGRLIAASFIYAHVVIFIFLLVGFRDLFSIPTEVRANWIFRITEQEGRREWLGAVDRFVLLIGGGGLLLVPLPLEFKLRLARISEVILLGAFGLLCFERVFYGWEKLPFTCSHLPGKFPMWIRALQLFTLFAFLAPVNALPLSCLYNWALFLFVLTILLVSWVMLHSNRMRARDEVRLKYEELPDPAILSLSLLK